MRPAARTDLDTNIMRIVAAFFVVLLHSVGESDGANLVISCICRFSVPVFVLISGRYLLHGERKLGYFLRKSLHFLLLILCWSAIFYIYHRIIGTLPDVSLPVYLLTQPIHLWYLWMIACLYLLTPILSVFVNSAKKEIFIYALVITALLGSPLTVMLRSGRFELLAELMDKTKLPTQLGFIFLFLLGDYLQRYEPKLPFAAWLAIFAAGTGFTIAGTLYLSRGGTADYLLLSFFSPGAMAAAVGFFGMCEKLFREKEISAARSARIGALASATLGVYLMHPLILDVLRELWNGVDGMSDALYSVILALAAFVISAVISWLLGKLPAVKRLVK